MARSAVESRMHSCERKAGELQVIELGAMPRIHRVAALAGYGKSCRAMIENGCRELLRVAGVAVRAQTRELPGCGADVAVLALCRRVRANKRKAVLMVLDRLHVHLPALHRVAALAVGTHLAAMEVSVTVGALHPDVRKHQAGMALPAAHVHVHAAQRILCFVVIEFGNGSQRTPRGVRVAVLTSQVEGAVRAHNFRARCSVLSLDWHRQSKCYPQQQPDFEAASAHPAHS